MTRERSREFADCRDCGFDGTAVRPPYRGHTRTEGCALFEDEDVNDAEPVVKDYELGFLTGYQQGIKDARITASQTLMAHKRELQDDQPRTTVLAEVERLHGVVTEAIDKLNPLNDDPLVTAIVAYVPTVKAKAVRATGYDGKGNQVWGVNIDPDPREG